MHDTHRKSRATLLLMTANLIAILMIFGFSKALVNAPPATQKQPAAQTPQKAPSPVVSKSSVDDPNSLQIIVNKKRPLPDGFAPSDLSGVMRQEASGHIGQLFASAKNAGHSLKIISGYRSQTVQKNLYDSYVRRDGVAAADRYSARPRHSEHQTGLAVDIGTGKCDLEICFGATPAGQWLAAHAQEYGFIIRYAEGKEALTGYQYEPWHLRYVGVGPAKEIKKSGQTMEQYFGLPPAPNY